MQERQQQRSDAPAVTVGREIPREPPSNPGRRSPSPPQSLPTPAPRLAPTPTPTSGAQVRRCHPQTTPAPQLSLGILGDDLRLVVGRTYLCRRLLVHGVRL